MESEKIANIYLDRGSVIARTPEVEHEYKTAITDLLENNYFRLCDVKNLKKPPTDGPYDLHLSIADNRLVMDIRRHGDINLHKKVALPISPFRKVIKDYFLICESYYEAVKQSTSAKVETLDMARRSLHNEGSVLLTEILKPDIAIDFDTARRLFTLICVLHIR